MRSNGMTKRGSRAATALTLALTLALSSILGGPGSADALVRRTPEEPVDLSLGQEGPVIGIGFSPHTRAILDTLRPDPADIGRRYPETWDWREMGGVTGLRNQGACGSCWAFGAIAEVEGNLKLAEGIGMNLSEQQAVDCNTWGNGCDGGWPDSAYELVMSPGAVSEECMPYLAIEGSCAQRLCEKVAYIDGYDYISGNVDSYKAAIMNGPICACTWNHCVSLIGWDESRGSWLVKNSAPGYFHYMDYGFEGITTGALQCVNPHIPRARLVPDEYATIGDALAASERGDTIKIKGGLYTERITVGNVRTILGGYDPTFTVRDPDLYPTVIDGGFVGDVVSCGGSYYGSDHVTIDGIEIRNSGAAGSGISIVSGEVLVRRSTVTGCGRGVSVTGSVSGSDRTVRIEFCTIRDNSGAGVHASAVDDDRVAVHWSGIYENDGDGVYASDSVVDIVNSTIALNGADGVDLNNSEDSAVSYSVIASNTGTGMACSGTPIDVTSSDVWDNAGGNYDGATPGEGCISEDPIFCDAGAGDLTLHATSPCAGQGDFGQNFGAYEVGCPEGPRNLSIAQDGASLLLSWSPPPGDFQLDHYVVYRDTLWWGREPLAIVDGADTTYTDVTIPPCMIHDYCVTAVDTGGIEGAQSDELEVELCYVGPQDLEVAFGEAGNDLAWSPAAGPVVRYIIARGTDIAPPDSIGGADAPAGAYVDAATAACPRDRYAYEIWPVYDTGWRGQPSALVSVDPAPSPPSGLAAEWVGGDIVLTWEPNCESDFRRYWVYCDTIPISPPPRSELLVGFTAETTFTHESPDPATTYFYRLTASDQSGQKSAYSGTAYLGTGTTLTVPAPYGTIQSAIDAASALDTVAVAPGTYTESIVLKDGVCVVATGGAAGTTIEWSEGSVVTASGLSDLVLLRGFTVDGNGTATCCLDGWGTYARIEDCVFRNASTGARFRYGGAADITGSQFLENDKGIAVSDSASPFLASNTFDGNGLAGIYNSGDPGPRVGGTLEDANDFLSVGVYHVYNGSESPLDADLNYWGDVCVDPAWFSGPVEYVPWTDAAHDGTYTECADAVADGELRARAYVSSNHPNPFNPSTTIGYGVPAPGGRVVLTIYDLAGRLVRTLVDEERRPGAHAAIWHGRDDHGGELASGVYFYRLEIGEFRVGRTMVLLK